MALRGVRPLLRHGDQDGAPGAATPGVREWPRLVRVRGEGGHCADCGGRWYDWRYQAVDGALCCVNHAWRRQKETRELTLREARP